MAGVATRWKAGRREHRTHHRSHSSGFSESVNATPTGKMPNRHRRARTGAPARTNCHGAVVPRPRFGKTEKLGTGVNEGDSAVASGRRTPGTARPSRGQVNPELVGRGLLPCLAAKREAFPQRLSQRLHLCLRLRFVDMIDPVGRRRHGPRGEPALMPRMPAMPEPGPSPVLGSFNEVGPQRVSLDVVADQAAHVQAFTSWHAP